MAERHHQLPHDARRANQFQIKTHLVAHLMESGHAGTQEGKLTTIPLIPRMIINNFTFTFNGKPFFPASGISGGRHPYRNALASVEGKRDVQIQLDRL